MADIGERLGGDNIEFTIDQPLRVIIGGPPHSGKSTLMNLLEDRFRYYQIPVELLDLDLSSPTPLKAGFTEQREKKKWTSTLADEARSMFEEAEGVQVVLGDSVGLISEINEIISQPADVAILLVSGGHGDYDTTYRKVVRKWKEYYEDIHKPLLVVLRSTMNPADESMFDPQDNYGIIVGMDRDAYEDNTISGHYRYEGLYPTNACLEGIVFEIAQSFDMKVRSPTDPEHLALLNSKWSDLKDKKTWTPPAGSMLGGIERAYFQERGRVPADQRAESFEFLTKSGHEVQWDDGSFYMTFKDPVDGYGDVNGDWYGGENQSPDEIILDVEPAWNEETDEEYDVPSLHIEFSQVESYGIKNHNMSVWDGGVVSPELFGAIQEGLEGMVSDYGAESFGAEGDYEPSFDSLEERIEWMEFAVNDKFLHQYEDEYSNVVLDIEEWNENNGNHYYLERLVKQYKNKMGWMDAESFGADGQYLRKSKYDDNGRWDIYWEGDSRYRNYAISLKDNPNDIRIVVEYGDGGYSLAIPQPDTIKNFSTMNEVLEYLDNMGDVRIGVFTHRFSTNRSYPTVGDWGAESFGAEQCDCEHWWFVCPDCGYDTEKWETHCPKGCMEEGYDGNDHPTKLKEYARCDIHGEGFDPKYAESFGSEDDLTFQEWADQEMMTHGKPEPFDDWLDDELSHHGDNVSLNDWGNHELDSHYERYGAESKTRRRIKQEAMFSQMMIASLIGLGTGLWGVSKWRDSQRSL